MRMHRLSASAGTGLALLLLMALAATLLGLSPQAARADACPNAAERFGASANLPDCRAYELVTPQIKADNSLITEIDGQADGQHVTMTSILPFPGAANGEPQPVLSSRTAAGWVTTPLSPPQGQGKLDNLQSEDTGNIPLRASFTKDFSAAFVDSPFASDPLDQNLSYDVYRVDTPGGESSLASIPESGATTELMYRPPGRNTGELAGSFIAGNSDDGSHVFFTTLGRLPTAPGTPADTHLYGNEIYERYGGHTYLVGILPDGSVAPCGAEVGGGADTGVDYYSDTKWRAVSPDGSNVVFHTAADSVEYGGACLYNFHQSSEYGGLYLREDNGTAAARTVSLPGTDFLGRTPDGSKIFSTDLGDRTAEGPALYVFDVATGQATKLGYGGLLAYSDDGSRIYYLSGEALKVDDHGVTKTIPNVGSGYSGEEYGPGTGGSNLPATTPDGSKLLFMDRANLTSYNVNGPSCGEINAHWGTRGSGYLSNCSEAYIYDLNSGAITCVSCNPTGAPPVANVHLFQAPSFEAWMPKVAPLISDDGSRAFFETGEALVPQDTNGIPDVYEWENGHVYLLSSGQGGIPGHPAPEHGNINNENFGVDGSMLVGASANGDDVFIATDDRLLPQDIENSLQVYDVRVGGGFPYTPPTHGCDSGQCQGPQTPAPSFAPPSSATFVGLGNPASEVTTAKAKAKPKAKSKSKHKAKPKHKAKKARAKRKQSNRKAKGKK